MALVPVSLVFAQEKIEKKLSNFTSLMVSVNAEVHISQTNEHSIKIEGSSKLLEKIEIEQDGDKVKISYKDKTYNGLEKAVVWVNMNDIDKIGISGSGKLVNETPIKTENLSFSISGSGDVVLTDLEVENIKASISGSGDINISGNGVAKSISLAVSGSGKFNSERLQAQEVTTSISGSGNSRVWATERLKARVSGSGNVYYRGKAIVDAKISGSGSIKPID